MKLDKSNSESIAAAVSSTSDLRRNASSQWNSTCRHYPQDKLTAELVSEQAQKTPAALALASEIERLTYSQLDARANQLARRLQSLGVGPEVLVGICLERSPQMVIAALAVLRAGGAYVPMDPESPPARLDFMLRDTRLPVLITSEQIARSLPPGGWTPLILDREPAQSQPDAPEPVSVGLDNLAYVIYTSGSTGQPKAVQITQRGLLNLIYWHQRVFSIIASDRASQVASFGFDAAVWELWPYLTAGASVHFPDDATRSSVNHLHDWLLEKNINVSFVPTAMAEGLLALDWPSSTALRFLLTGADTLRRYPPANLPFRLINNYGPTECTVVATSGEVFSDVRPYRQPTIGWPIDNVQVHILDEHRNPVPVGTVGELYIGGEGLARGYLNRSGQNAESFITHPLGNSSSGRLYRTGDLGRYLPDGQIVFIGRTDEQVKIRGYRIEPNEIVSLLNQYPAVQASAVVARADNGGEKRLTAYVVSSDPQLTRAALQDHLRAQLPDYMVPSAFVRMDKLPTNASGKIDRAALPAPTSANSIGDHIYVAPRTEVERGLVVVLAELLGMEKVGVNDNFFFLGGHSLLGTQLIARVRNIFGVELSLRTVFDSPTVAELSDEIERSLSREHQISAD